MSTLSGVSLEFATLLQQALAARQSLRREDVEFELAAINVLGAKNAAQLFLRTAGLFSVLTAGPGTIPGTMANTVTDRLRRKAAEIKGSAINDDVVKRYEARLLRVKAECDALARAEGFGEEDVQRRRRLLQRELVGGATNA